MPGELRRNAKCPKCGARLAAIVDSEFMTISNVPVLIRKFFHAGPAARQQCRLTFRGRPAFREARNERHALETVPKTFTDADLAGLSDAERVRWLKTARRRHLAGVRRLRRAAHNEPG